MGWMANTDKMTVFEWLTIVPIVFILSLWMAFVRTWPLLAVILMGAIAWKYLR